MADEAWDDDDFGTFESADASILTKVPDPVSTQLSTPAWLLAAQHEHHDQESLKSDSADTDDLFKELAPSKQRFSTEGKETDKSHEHSDSPKKSNTTVTSISVGDWKPFSLNSDQNDSIKPMQSSQTTSQTDSIKDLKISKPPSNSLKPVITKDADIQVEEKESEQVFDLKGKLDNAIMLKLQTEESLKKLQDDLSKAVEDSRKEKEKKERKHQVEIEEMKENFEKEMTSLREESQKMMRILTEKYAALSSQSAAEMRKENDENIEAVVGKCLGILESQGSTLSEKLAKEAAANDENVSNLIGSCRKELKDFVQSNCDSTVSKCEKLKEEISEHLKAEITREVEAQRQIDLRCKEQAMEELSRNFKLQLEESMKIERKKTEDAIREAVEEARDSTKKSLQQGMKKNKLMQDQHVMALQMLLTSSQEHLRHLTEALKSNEM